MSWLNDLLNTAKDVFKGAVQVGRAVAKAAAPVIKQVMDGARKLVDEATRRAGKTFRDEPTTVRESLERELQEINEQILSLRKIYRKTGNLNSKEQQLHKHLRQRRAEINEQLTGIDQVVQAGEMVEQEQHYKPVTITDENAHVLQYHVGQSTYNKSCDVCGRAMVLQWRRDLKSAGLKDFYWGCSGWYIEHNGKQACGRTLPLAQADLNLFANLNRPEFEVKSSDLARETLDSSRAKRIRDALDSIRGEHRKREIGIATYRCPIHGESLVLKRKKETTDGLLDEYFLGCPRWRHENAGCNFLIKLKSAAQISGVLNSEIRKGVLGV